MFYRGELNWWQILESHPEYENYHLTYNNQYVIKDNLEVWLDTMKGANILQISLIDLGGTAANESLINLSNRLIEEQYLLVN